MDVPSVGEAEEGRGSSGSAVGGSDPTPKPAREDGQGASDGGGTSKVLSMLADQQAKILSILDKLTERQAAMATPAAASPSPSAQPSSAAAVAQPGGSDNNGTEPAATQSPGATTNDDGGSSGQESTSGEGSPSPDPSPSTSPIAMPSPVAVPSMQMPSAIPLASIPPVPSPIPEPSPTPSPSTPPNKVTLGGKTYDSDAQLDVAAALSAAGLSSADGPIKQALSKFAAGNGGKLPASVVAQVAQVSAANGGKLPAPYLMQLAAGPNAPQPDQAPADAAVAAPVAPPPASSVAPPVAPPPATSVAPAVPPPVEADAGGAPPAPPPQPVGKPAPGAVVPAPTASAAAVPSVPAGPPPSAKDMAAEAKAAGATAEQIAEMQKAMAAPPAPVDPSAGMPAEMIAQMPKGSADVKAIAAGSRLPSPPSTAPLPSPAAGAVAATVPPAAGTSPVPAGGSTPTTVAQSPAAAVSRRPAKLADAGGAKAAAADQENREIAAAALAAVKAADAAAAAASPAPITEAHPTNAKPPAEVVAAEVGAAKACAVASEKVNFLRFLYENYNELAAKAAQRAVHAQLTNSRTAYAAAVNASYAAERERISEAQATEVEARAVARKKEAADRRAAAERRDLVRDAVATAKSMASKRKDTDLAAARMELGATLRSEMEEMRQREEAREGVLNDDMLVANDTLAKATAQRDRDVRTIRAGVAAYSAQLNAVRVSVEGLLEQLQGMTQREGDLAAEIHAAVTNASTNVRTLEGSIAPPPAVPRVAGGVGAKFAQLLAGDEDGAAYDADAHDSMLEPSVDLDAGEDAALLQLDDGVAEGEGEGDSVGGVMWGKPTGKRAPPPAPRPATSNQRRPAGNADQSILGPLDAGMFASALAAGLNPVASSDFASPGGPFTSPLLPLGGYPQSQRRTGAPPHPALDSLPLQQTQGWAALPGEAALRAVLASAPTLASVTNHVAAAPIPDITGPVPWPAAPRQVVPRAADVAAGEIAAAATPKTAAGEVIPPLPPMPNDFFATLPTLPGFQPTASQRDVGKPLAALADPVPLPIPAGTPAAIPKPSGNGTAGVLPALLTRLDVDVRSPPRFDPAAALREAAGFQRAAAAAVASLQQQVRRLEVGHLTELDTQLTNAKQLLAAREERYRLAAESAREALARREELRKLDADMARYRVRCSDGTYVHDGLSCVGGVAGVRGDASEFADDGPVARDIKRAYEKAAGMTQRDKQLDGKLRQRISTLQAAKAGTSDRIARLNVVIAQYRAAVDVIATHATEIQSLAAAEQRLAPQVASARTVLADQYEKLSARMRDATAAVDRINTQFQRVAQAVQARLNSDRHAIADARKALDDAYTLSNMTMTAKTDKLSADYDVRQKRGDVHAAARVQEEESAYVATLAQASESRRAAEAAAAAGREAAIAAAAAKRIADVKAAASLLAAETAAAVEAERAKLRDAQADMAANAKVLNGITQRRAAAVASVTSRVSASASALYANYLRLQKLDDVLLRGAQLLRRHIAAAQYAHTQAVRVIESGGAVIPTDPLAHMESAAVAVQKQAAGAAQQGAGAPPAPDTAAPTTMDFPLPPGGSGPSDGVGSQAAAPPAPPAAPGGVLLETSSHTRRGGMLRGAGGVRAAALRSRFPAVLQPASLLQFDDAALAPVVPSAQRLAVGALDGGYGAAALASLVNGDAAPDQHSVRGRQRSETARHHLPRLAARMDETAEDAADSPQYAGDAIYDDGAGSEGPAASGDGVRFVGQPSATAAAPLPSTPATPSMAAAPSTASVPVPSPSPSPVPAAKSAAASQQAAAREVDPMAEVAKPAVAAPATSPKASVVPVGNGTAGNATLSSPPAAAAPPTTNETAVNPVGNLTTAANATFSPSPSSPPASSPSPSPAEDLRLLPVLQVSGDPIAEPQALPAPELPGDGVPPELEALAASHSAPDKVQTASQHYLRASRTSAAAAQILAGKLAEAAARLAAVKAEHTQLTVAYFRERLAAAAATEAACKREAAVVTDLEAQTVSDTDKLEAKAALASKAAGKSDLFTLAQITGVHVGPGAAGPPPVAEGPQRTLTRIKEHVVTRVRESSLEAAQANAVAAELQAAAAAAQVTAAGERAKLAAQRVAHAGAVDVTPAGGTPTAAQ